MGRRGEEEDGTKSENGQGMNIMEESATRRAKMAEGQCLLDKQGVLEKGREQQEEIEPSNMKGVLNPKPPRQPKQGHDKTRQSPE